MGVKQNLVARQRAIDSFVIIRRASVPSLNILTLLKENRLLSSQRQQVQQNKSNPSSLWKVINRVILSKNKEPQRVYTKDLKTVADDFNVFFTSVGKTAALAASYLDALPP